MFPVLQYELEEKKRSEGQQNIPEFVRVRGTLKRIQTFSSWRHKGQINTVNNVRLTFTIDRQLHIFQIAMIKLIYFESRVKAYGLSEIRW